MKKQKKELIDDDSEKFDFIKTTKNNIINVLHTKDTLATINDLVIKTNKIVIRACNFIKLYYLYLYENNLTFPIIDKNFICDVFKSITIRKNKSGSLSIDELSEQLINLQNFYNNHFIHTLDKDDILYYDKLNYILAYEAIDIEKNVNNNIKEHFITHLNKFVNYSFDLQNRKEEIAKIKDKTERKLKYQELNTEFRYIKQDLVTFDEFKSDTKYHTWINKHRKFIIPDKKEFDKDSIYYDLHSNTQDYLKAFIYIGKQLEEIYDKQDEDDKEIRLFNILPLRSNIISKSITIDTCGLIQNFLGDESTSEHYKNYKKDNNQYKLWNKFFKLDEKIFTKNRSKNIYTFHYMIKTDGISISINFVRLKDGKPLKFSNKNNKPDENTKYIEKIEITDDIKNKKIVTCDPNYSDILYCGSKNDDGELETFRYTQNQRRLETRTKRYSKIIDKINKETIIDDKTIKEHESILSKYNKKTCNYNKFKDYLIEKNKLNLKLFKHYEQKIFRKFKLNRYINTQKSESKMIKNFTNKFGSPDKTLFIMGDYDKGDNNMKGVEPTICKKFRKIFKNAGYETYLINEFRTSKKCNCCLGDLEPFMIRKSNKPRDIKKNKNITVHGLLRHEDVKQKCELIHNRDKNAVQNMLNIVESIFQTGKRPKIFTRTDS